MSEEEKVVYEMRQATRDISSSIFYSAMFICIGLDSPFGAGFCLLLGLIDNYVMVIAKKDKERRN